MKIIAKKDKFMHTIILDIILEIFFLIPTILIFFLLLDIKPNILGILISLFILSVPNVFLIGNIITGIRYYKSISIVLEDNTLYLNLLLPSKNISRKDKVYNPYKLVKASNKYKYGAYIPKKYEIDLKNIEEYGYKNDLNINNYLYDGRDIVIISNDKKYYIITDNFNYKDIIDLINEIYKITKIKPTGELKNIIVK